MTDPATDTSIPLEITTITSGTEKIIAAEVEELIDSVGLPLRQYLMALLDAMDTLPGYSSVLYPGAGVYARMTANDIEWLGREHNCRVVPPACPRP